MSRAAGPRWAFASLLLLVATFSGCRCTWCASSAELDREIGKHRVKVEGESAHEWGIDGIGAPHVGGIIWPTVAGAGYVIRLVVDDRPEVPVSGGKEMPSKKELTAKLEAVEIEGAPDDAHLAVRVPPETEWRILHLLPRGVPFDATSVPAMAVLDWAKVPDAVAVASAELRAPACHEEKACALLWSAVGAQQAASAIDDVLLEIWPAARPSGPLVLARAKAGSGASNAWRAAAAARALGVVENAGHRSAAVDLLVALEDRPALDGLDARLIALWKADAGDEGTEELVGKRLEADQPAFAVSAANRAAATAVARSRVTSDEHMDGATSILVLAGTPDDVAWMDDTLLPLWPRNDKTGRSEDPVHEVLVQRATRPDKGQGWGPPPSPAWVERATDRAAALLRREEMQQKAALAKSNTCFDEAFAEASQLQPYTFLPEARGLRAASCTNLVVALDGERLPCERWTQIARVAKHVLIGAPSDHPPDRCRADAGKP